MDNQRNILLAAVLAFLVLFGWDAAMRHFYPQPLVPHPEATASAPAATAGPARGKPTREGGLVDPGEVALERKDLSSELAAPGRVPIAAPGLSGSIDLTGALLDDLTLNRHRATIDKDSGPVRMFSPPGTPAQHYAQFGWVAGNGASLALPDARTVWTAPPVARLTPRSPVTLTWSNATGQTFAITYAIDQDYLITATQAVTNRAAAPIGVRPYAFVNRTNRTASVRTYNIHSGPIGAFDDVVRFGPRYDEVADGSTTANAGKVDWLGFTDIYWMSALIPDAAGGATSDFHGDGDTIYRADLLYQPTTVAPGQTLTRTTRLFAGAKESGVLDRYEAAGVPKFGLAIDWGWFRWFEKPIFWLLLALFHAVGNFGAAIILLTVIVRGIMFPVAQRQFASMAAMRAIQPKMKTLQERHKEDKAKLNQEVMALYKAEGVNPLAGCLPVFLQIPIFFALYKVLNLSIEMRHQPFALWIRDLSAPDPAHLLNLFGLLPFTPSGFFAIGLLALLLGFTMWLQFKLNPASPDPVQQQMFSIMPWIMMFVMAPFAAGLLIYWITSNLITIAQQKYLYSRHPQLQAASAGAAAGAAKRGA